MSFKFPFHLLSKDCIGLVAVGLRVSGLLGFLEGSNTFSLLLWCYIHLENGGGQVLEHVLGKMLKLWLWTEMLRGRERKGKAYNRHLLSQESANAVYYFWLTAVLALRSEITILLLEDTSMFVSRLRKPRLSHVRYVFHVCKNVSLFRGFI